MVDATSPGKRAVRIGDHVLPIVMLAPLLILFGITCLYMITNSFQTKELFQSVGSAGFANYIEILRSPRFWSSVRFGLLWAFETVILQTIVGFALALLLNEVFLGRSVARAVIFIPYLLMGPVTALLFLLLFGSTFGLFAVWLRSMGFNIYWYGSDYASLLLTMSAVWHYAPFSMLILLAGLQSIPAELYEAAKIDGANVFQRFIHVTLPSMRDALFVAIVLRMIFMFNKFDLPWLVTAGGPVGKTENVAVYIYKQAFENFNLGTASAAGTLMLAMICGLIFIHFKLYERSGKQS
ncbi:carbohydrate ABC transporter permease [Microvirga aerophila]|uniref:Sugar ABC transporter permease n=1 Tax=Microvirga aerophila TaxID=670291 RepID=A0A512BW01_9HYPH|nr:sugar ABC transporter permease [Microvirga aerophila]GEO16123.1 sugar ABC transporter permease [Microvirga aerophila]